MSGFAPLGRLISLALICAGLGTSTVLATAETAQAAGSNSPTAIGVSSGGTSYVGFASGGKLLRLDASGDRKKPVPLDQDEAVDGLFVSAGDDIWVDYESSVSLLTPNGKVVAHFDHDPVIDCDSTAPASRYGGITAHGNRVYVANRCDDSISVYSRTGSLLATVDLPGNDFPRGITYGGPQAGRPATLYVAIPDRGQILSYNASTIRSSSQRARTFTLDRPSGGQRPEPAGLVADRYGQVVASDVANNALYFLDANNNYSLYRTLGHPPRASRQAGRLNSPGAIAQHDQDGGGLAGNLFIADTNNDRVQRWSTGGYTYWAKGVRAVGGGDDNDDDPSSGGGGATTIPENTVPPEVNGDPEVGTTLSCYAGAWTGKPKSFQRAWLRGSEVIGGATGTYTPVDFDKGKQISCRVRATNAKGTSDWATSDPVTIPGGDDPGGDDPDTGTGPANTTLPSIIGTASVGQTLTCSLGTWTGTAPITYGVAWKRAGTAIAGATASTYTVAAADIGTALTCAVSASNGDGTVTATSAPVSVSAAPVNTALPSITGVPAVGQVLTCNPGSWTGQAPITYAWAWRRGTTPITGATGSTYTTVTADLDAALSCVVVGSNAAGFATATSPTLTIGAAPAVLAMPFITPTTGAARIGTALTCNKGTWSGVDNSYAFAWYRDGVPIPGIASSTYVVLTEDANDDLACNVTATNAVGSATQTTVAKTVEPLVGGAPLPTVAPAVSGTATTGQTLTCGQGTWTGDPTITYVAIWQRNGTTVSGGWTYTLTAADADATVSCVVVATNGAGNGAARSGAVGGNGCGGAVGVRINNGDLRTTSPLVRLSIRAPAGVTSVRISNNADFSGAVTVPVVDSCTYDWTMNAIAGLPLDWSVYVRFEPDPATTYQDSITVDVASRSAARR